MLMTRLAVCLYLCVLVPVSLRSQQPGAAPQPSNALPAVRTGAQIYDAACATCAPVVVREWITGPPSGVEVRPVSSEIVAGVTDDLDLGERSAHRTSPNRTIKVGTLLSTAIVADDCRWAATEDTQFQAHLTSVPRSVPTRGGRSACTKLRNLLSIIGLRERRRSFKPVSLRDRLHEKYLQDPQVLSGHILRGLLVR